MRGVFIEQIAAGRGWNVADVRAEEVHGGFTKSTKFVISNAAEADSTIFAKVVDPAKETLDAVILRTEADHYQTFGRLGILGKFLPELVGFVDTAKTTALLIGNLSQATWGGPWTERNVKNLHAAITGVHQTMVPDNEKVHIKGVAQRLNEILLQENPHALNEEDEERLFEQVWDSGKTAIINSRGQHFFQANPELYSTIKAQVKLWDKRAGERLILRDLNFGNIAVLPESVMFVDPVYTDIGNPAGDMANLGVGLLRILPEGSEHDTTKRFIKEHFLDNLPALAAFTRSLLAISTLEYKGEHDSWMDYHQELAVIALRLWQELLDFSSK